MTGAFHWAGPADALVKIRQGPCAELTEGVGANILWPRWKVFGVCRGPGSHRPSARLLCSARSLKQPREAAKSFIVGIKFAVTVKSKVQW